MTKVKTRVLVVTLESTQHKLLQILETGIVWIGSNKVHAFLLYPDSGPAKHPFPGQGSTDSSQSVDYSVGSENSLEATQSQLSLSQQHPVFKNHPVYAAKERQTFAAYTDHQTKRQEPATIAPVYTNDFVYSKKPVFKNSLDPNSAPGSLKNDPRLQHPRNSGPIYPKEPIHTRHVPKDSNSTGYPNHQPVHTRPTSVKNPVSDYNRNRRSLKDKEVIEEHPPTKPIRTAPTSQSNPNIFQQQVRNQEQSGEEEGEGETSIFNLCDAILQAGRDGESPSNSRDASLKDRHYYPPDKTTSSQRYYTGSGAQPKNMQYHPEPARPTQLDLSNRQHYNPNQYESVQMHNNQSPSNGYNTPQSYNNNQSTYNSNDSSIKTPVNNSQRQRSRGPQATQDAPMNAIGALMAFIPPADESPPPRRARGTPLGADHATSFTATILSTPFLTFISNP